MHQSTRQQHRHDGFTLIELIVVIVVLAILAAVAVPKFINMATDARVAAVRGAYGAISAGAAIANAKCRTVDVCIQPNGASSLMTGPDGQMGVMSYGYPTGQTRFYSYFGIKDWVQIQDFAVTELNNSVTEFSRSDASDPTACKIRYIEAPAGLDTVPTITMFTNGG